MIKPEVDVLRRAASEGKLVAVIGTGVSMALTEGKFPALAWQGLIKDGFAHGVLKGKITADQLQKYQSHIASDDLDELLGAAEFMGRKLGAPHGDLYARWFEAAVGGARPTNTKMVSAIEALTAAGVPLCTLNYDQLLEQVTGLPKLTLEHTRDATAFVRRARAAVLHLHGTYDSPATCILGIRDYEATLNNEVRDLLQRTLATFSQLLFIGCNGTFADPNFSALIAWLRKNLGAAALNHYALVKDSEVARSNADPAWHGFVEPISYGETHADLPSFLYNTFKTAIKPTAKKKRAPSQARAGTAAHATLLASYRKFLLKDCGEMTIEGVRADMDTAQRRFDIERLFVPLQVEDCLPQPSRPYQRRGFNFAPPCAFSQAFADNKALALLALPGGGKTLLLKRLVVAYADPARRQRSNDALPDLDLTPVLIRCREWREHLHRPILTLLDSLPAMTGQPGLLGLRDALVPLFKSGRILLLVDGLDEIHDDAIRSTFVEHLEAFMRDHKRTRLVVTSREAGFSLIAPRLASFCNRYRIAPLGDDAIQALCSHWHRLMVSESPDAETEANEVTHQILQKDSLRRLAENPLLLTMLLVVKHGAGGMPADRVSLYGRAVEILLSTWNIKGHDPLNPKEAVPQLAYVAYQMMCAGIQTATEDELLAFIEEAREKVPHIRYYAKDTPQQFLKRVEVRASLLIEVGHQVENGRMVPFYQFRHLTFQEYLTAVAVVDGHYPEYSKDATVLAPLDGYLIEPPWKEVIPMVAVLAKKQAEPLIGALVEHGITLRSHLEGRIQRNTPIDDFLNSLPLIERLVDCLVEEAEATPATLRASFQIAACFSNACTLPCDWLALSRGPYGAAFLLEAWALYAPMNWPRETRLGTTLAQMAAWRHPRAYWISIEGLEGLRKYLRSPEPREIALGLFTCVGLMWDEYDVYREDFDEERMRNAALSLLPDVESHIWSNNPALWGLAAWAWAFQIRHSPQPTVSDGLPDRLLKLWVSGDCKQAEENVAFALSALRLPRSAWTPTLTVEQRQRVTADTHDDPLSLNASIMVAFYARDVFSDEQLALRAATALQPTFQFSPQASQWIRKALSSRTPS